MESLPLTALARLGRGKTTITPYSVFKNSAQLDRYNVSVLDTSLKKGKHQEIQDDDLKPYERDVIKKASTILNFSNMERFNYINQRVTYNSEGNIVAKKKLEKGTIFILSGTVYHGNISDQKAKLLGYKDQEDLNNHSWNLMPGRSDDDTKGPFIAPEAGKGNFLSNLVKGDEKTANFNIMRGITNVSQADRPPYPDCIFFVARHDIEAGTELTYDMSEAFK